ncbi:MAG: flagellar biosynthesis anti-sigma factor FlgM [Planctomycetia bacterium]|nr:flagellar biosynthesis anti-sigma factor FlgM [Planctomycetia bacterium]
MQFNGINGPSNINKAQQVQSIRSETPDQNSLQEAKNDPSAKDTVEISQNKTSQASNISSTASGSEGIRLELVNRVRAEILAGTYDTEEKMDIALSRLLDELEGR